MKTIIFLLLALCSITMHAGKDNYMDYYKRINEAEALFLENNIEGALDNYKSIFTDYAPFAKDCYIALELSAMCCDTGRTAYFLAKGFENGLSWSTVSTIRQVQQLFARYPLYQKQMLNRYKQLRSSYIARLNCYVRGICVSMQKKDGTFHEIPWDSWGNKNIRDSLYAKVLTDNVTELVDLVRQYGFPGEKMIGVFDYEIDTYCDEGVNLRLEPVVTLFFWHQGCGYFLLKNELMDAVKKGELHPRTYALTYEWAFKDIQDRPHNSSKINLSKFYKDDCRQNQSQQFHYNFYIDHRLDHKDTAKVNKDRSALGICSLEHDRRKKEFERKHGVKLFFGLFNYL